VTLVERQQPIVLVVEDNEAIRENIAEILAAEGYRTWLAATADDALRLLQLELRAPDVIVLDLWLPGMRADRFLSHVKDRATWSRAAILLTTAASEAEIPKTLPVDAVLLKPFTIQQLLALVAASLEPREAAEPPRR
jgi:DNA-binding response OmpR family regulator